MTEEVSTGGLVRFRYGKDNKKSELSDEKKKEIAEAYAAAEERKEREKRNKMIMWIVIGLIVLLIAGWIVWKFIL